MSYAGSWFRRLRRVAAVAILGGSLGGCFDIDQRLTLQPGGSAAIELSMRFDRNMEDVVKLLEAYASFSAEAEKFKDGLCAAAQRFVEETPVPGKQFQAQQFTLDDRFVCQFKIGVARISDLEVAGPGLPLEIQPLAPRRYRVALNLTGIPDFSKELQSELAQSLKKELPLAVPEEEMAALWSKHITAAAAMMRMLMPNRYVQFTVAGSRVVESNGTVAADGQSVSFRLSFAELVTLSLDADARKGKEFYAVVEY